MDWRDRLRRLAVWALALELATSTELAHLALCLDCDETWPLGRYRVCPHCASRSFVLATRFLPALYRRREDTMPDRPVVATPARAGPAEAFGRGHAT